MTTRDLEWTKWYAWYPVRAYYDSCSCNGSPYKKWVWRQDVWWREYLAFGKKRTMWMQTVYISYDPYNKDDPCVSCNVDELIETRQW